jgi:hypothetical protein
MYFRFFLHPDNYCKAFSLSARADYGVPAMAMSTLDAYPTFGGAAWQKVRI